MNDEYWTAERTNDMVNMGFNKNHLNKLREANIRYMKIGDNPVFGCLNCGESWSPILTPKLDLPLGYWKCPNGCNTTERRTIVRRK